MAHARLITIGLVMLLAAGGCSGPSYKASPATSIPADMGDNSSQHVAPAMDWTDDFFVSVDPYSDPERQKAVFDADFSKTGILAFQLLVRHTADRAMLVRREDMTLNLPGGRRLRPWDARSTANLISEKTGRFVSTGDIAESAIEQAVVCLVTLGLCPSGSAPEQHTLDREMKSRAARITDYKEKEFGDPLLAPGESAHGFVYFRVPPGTPAFDAAEFNIRFIPATGVGGVTVSRTVSGLGFPGSEPDPAATYVPRSRRGSKSCGSGGNPTQRWIGTWEAKADGAGLTIQITDHKVTGMIVTPDGTYRLDGTVNPYGKIEADIEGSGAEDSATLRGRFPLLETSVDASGAQQYPSLANLAFYLCY